MQAKTPRNTRERILELSLRLFNEIGEPTVTTSTIAEEMAISPGNLYYHFRNKNDIVNNLYLQFEQKMQKRLRLPENHNASVKEVWSYLQNMAEFLWEYRFFYRDANELLTGNRDLEKQFRQMIQNKLAFAKKWCLELVKNKQMVASASEIEIIVINMTIIATYWLSYQFVMDPRHYNDQKIIQFSLHQASLHIISVLAPYLRREARLEFELLAKEDNSALLTN